MCGDRLKSSSESLNLGQKSVLRVSNLSKKSVQQAPKFAADPLYKPLLGLYRPMFGASSRTSLPKPMLSTPPPSNLCCSWRHSWLTVCECTHAQRKTHAWHHNVGENLHPTRTRRSIKLLSPFKKERFTVYTWTYLEWMDDFRQQLSMKFEKEVICYSF